MDDVRSLRRPQGLRQFFVRRVRIPPEQVGPDRPPEEHRVLGNNADRLAQGGKPVFPEIPPGDPDSTAGDIVKAGDQIDQRGFAAAGAADDPDGLPGFGGKGDVLQARIAGGAVAGGNVLKGNRDGPLRQ